MLLKDKTTKICFEFIGEAFSANLDDKDDGGPDPCTKNFKKGRNWSYCFLFFCPKHGHCYGFHLILGAEGRKDPFSALLKYLPTAPRIIFYDFACQFSEYCLNREPGYFSKTEFFHDIFHSVNHTCPYAYTCESVENKRCFNTSCAEQFNSYFVKIKSTGRCLKLHRFMLYAQHMMYLWNKDRTARFYEQNRTLLNRVQPKEKTNRLSESDQENENENENENNHSENNAKSNDVGNGNDNNESGDV